MGQRKNRGSEATLNDGMKYGGDSSGCYQEKIEWMLTLSVE